MTANKLAHTNSTFQGHSLNVHTTNQAIAARNAILQNPELSAATHIIYVYKFGIDGETTESGYSDDKEVGTGEILMEKIEQSNLTNVFICVTRLKKGNNIGPSRFTYIKRCADKLIEIRDDYCMRQASTTSHLMCQSNCYIHIIFVLMLQYKARKKHFNPMNCN